MQPLTCPIPANMNPLRNNGFKFNVHRLPEVTFFCQAVNLPSLDLPPANYPTPLVNIPVPGDKLTFGQLGITFLIDEEMNNYLAIHDWMFGLGFPIKHQQYADFLHSRRSGASELINGYSDGTLEILDADNKPVRTVQYINCFPTSLTQIQFETTVTDPAIVAGQATFGYSYYQFS